MQLRHKRPAIVCEVITKKWKRFNTQINPRRGHSLVNLFQPKYIRILMLGTLRKRYLFALESCSLSLSLSRADKRVQSRTSLTLSRSRLPTAFSHHFFRPLFSSRMQPFSPLTMLIQRASSFAHPLVFRFFHYFFPSSLSFINCWFFGSK